jgi:hypothetical protein
LNWGSADAFFAISSLILLGSAIVGFSKRAGLSTFQRQAIGISILICVAGIVFLALLSIQFDFGDSIGPSRAHPYFTAGRLLSGALIPFALSYVYVIAFLVRLHVLWLRRAAGARMTALPLVVLAGVIAFLATSEMVVNQVAFSSDHNWFHR